VNLLHCEVYLIENYLFITHVSFILDGYLIDVCIPLTPNFYSEIFKITALQ
jgi:hypothetical protein